MEASDQQSTLRLSCDIDAHSEGFPFIRPSELAQDLSPDIDVFRHVLEWLRDHESYVPDLVVHLRPTGPVRRVELIDEAIEAMLSHPEAHSLRSVTRPLQTPYKMWRIEDGYLRPLLEVDNVKEPHCMPRQCLPQVYWQNGYVDIVRSRVILELGMMCGYKILPFVISERFLDLDYKDSVPLVEAELVKLLAGQRPEVESEADRHSV